MNGTVDVRDAYLRSAAAAVDLIGHRNVGDRWDEPSVLAEFTVRGLAGHLGRAILQVEWFLDADEPKSEPVSAVESFANLQGADRVDSPLNTGVRQRGEETAAGGWARLYLDTGNALDRLTGRLGRVPPDRRVLAFGQTLVIDEYLKTRLIELTVHLDDLSLSVGLPYPSGVPESATAIAIAVLAGVARTRVGDIAVLRALTRRERDPEPGALRVL